MSQHLGHVAHLQAVISPPHSCSQHQLAEKEGVSLLVLKLDEEFGDMFSVRLACLLNRAADE